MKDLVIGVHMFAADSKGLVDAIVAAEDAGIDVAWMTSGGVAPDPLAVFAAAAGRTSRIEFGTSIIPTFPRHPLALAQGAVVVDNLAPGRLRLGLGPSHKPIIDSMFGLPFERPLEHLKEYVTILKTLLGKGSVDFDGDRLHAHAQLGKPTRVKVMISALRRNAFRLAGEVADGGISWVSPLSHIRDVAVPATLEGARAVGREPPPVIAHVPVVVSSDTPAVRRAMLRQFSFYPRQTFYAAMFTDAGFPEAADGTFSEAMADALAISGNESQVVDKVQAIADFGAGEILVSVITIEEDREAYWRTLAVLGELAASS